MASKLELLHSLIDPVAVSLGYQLWGIELLSQGRHTLLRIYIDSENGVDVDDCAQLSRQVSAIFDVEDPITSEYTLEVSSPGMDRPLFTLEQFASLVGQVVALRLRAPFEGRRKFKGQIKGVEGDEVVVICEEHEFLFPIDSIEKANIVPQF